MNNQLTHIFPHRHNPALVDQWVAWRYIALGLFDRRPSHFRRGKQSPGMTQRLCLGVVILLWKLFYLAQRRCTFWEWAFCVGRLYCSGWKWSPVGRSESGSNSPVLFGLLSISHVGMRHTCDNHDGKVCLLLMFKIENILWLFWNSSHRPGSIGRNLKVAVRVASNGNPRPVVRDQVFVAAFQVTLFR